MYYHSQIVITKLKIQLIFVKSVLWSKIRAQTVKMELQLKKSKNGFTAENTVLDHNTGKTDVTEKTVLKVQFSVTMIIGSLAVHAGEFIHNDLGYYEFHSQIPPPPPPPGLHEVEYIIVQNLWNMLLLYFHVLR